MNRGYRLRGGSRRRTDARRELEEGGRVARPFQNVVERLITDLQIRQALGQDAALRQKIHSAIRSLARARAAGIDIPIRDAAVDRIVSAVALKIKPAEQPIEEPIPSWDELSDDPECEDLEAVDS